MQAGFYQCKHVLGKQLGSVNIHCKHYLCTVMLKCSYQTFSGACCYGNVIIYWKVITAKK